MVVAEVCSSMKYPKRCQYKHAKQKKYHVRNWAEYNEGLRRRGDLTVWFDEEAIANWKADKTGKPGGQRVYSDMAIETGLVVRMVYKLAYRQTEGFLHSIGIPCDCVPLLPFLGVFRSQQAIVYSVLNDRMVG